MHTCQYCKKECKSKNSLIQHEIRCKNNPDKIEVKPSYGMRGKKGSNQYIKGTAKPLSDAQRKRISENSKLIEWSEERRRQHSKRMQEVVKNNPDSYSKNNVSGRVKTYEHNGHKLKGTWELKVAKWLDHNNIQYQTEVYPSQYYWNKKWRLYFPDFYLTEYNIFIEVKGYKRERDICKWNHFNNVLIVLEKGVINKLDDLSLSDIINRYTWDSRLNG